MGWVQHARRGKPYLVEALGQTKGLTDSRQQVFPAACLSMSYKLGFERAKGCKRETTFVEAWDDTYIVSIRVLFVEVLVVLFCRPECRHRHNLSVQGSLAKDAGVLILLLGRFGCFLLLRRVVEDDTSILRSSVTELLVLQARHATHDRTKLFTLLHAATMMS